MRDAEVLLLRGFNPLYATCHHFAKFKKPPKQYYRLGVIPNSFIYLVCFN